MRLAALGDRGAWNVLVEEFQGLLRAIARAHRLADADAADVAQTTWLRLVENLDRLQDRSRVGAWLATTARRECLRTLRASARELQAEEAPERAEGDIASIDGGLLEAERATALWSAFGRLPARDQALLRMLIADPQPSYEEIGAALEMPIGSIGPTRGRALDRLRRELSRGDALVAWRPSSAVGFSEADVSAGAIAALSRDSRTAALLTATVPPPAIGR
jgi:RNA polymerase sigma factor (sigma-70 family)